MDNQYGKVSKLYLAAAYKDGKTVLEDVSFTAPFKMMHPFYEKKDVMTLMPIAVSAGIMAGDRQEMEIRVGERANVEVVSQSYEKIHRMDEGCAKKDVRISVGRHASLHYMPLPVIPFAGSDYRGTLEVELEDETSQFVLREILCGGRISHGEAFAYRRFQNRVRICQNGRIVYLDNACYEPSRMDMQGFGMYEGFTHLANLVICNQQKSQEWIRKTRELLDDAKEMEGGVTQTSAGHLVVRILGRSADQLAGITEKLLAEA